MRLMFVSFRSLGSQGGREERRVGKEVAWAGITCCVVLSAVSEAGPYTVFSQRRLQSRAKQALLNPP